MAASPPGRHGGGACRLDGRHDPDGRAAADRLGWLAGVDRPTLVCAGELDPVTPMAAARELAAALPEETARLEVVQGAGHFTWKDAPDRYWPLLAEFVTDPGLPRDIGAVYCPYQDEQLDR